MNHSVTLKFEMDCPESDRSLTRALKSRELAEALNEITKLPDFFEQTRDMDLKQQDMNVRYQLKIRGILEKHKINLKELLNE